MPPHLRHPIRDPDPSPETPGLLDRSVVLVGLMGAGKTAVGRRLAKRLSLPFADADQEIEQAAGCSVKDIFSVWGEPAFRDCERRVIRRLLSQAPPAQSAVDVLNGIAYDIATQRLFVTGKLWPYVFEIRLIEQS